MGAIARGLVLWFIIKVDDFTDDSEEAKKRIDRASASGGWLLVD